MKNRVMTGTYTYKNEVFEYNFYTSLSAIKKIEFISNVINILVNDNAYYSILKELIFNYAVIKTFTDIDTSEIDDASNMIDKIEEFIKEDMEEVREKYFAREQELYNEREQIIQQLYMELAKHHSMLWIQQNMGRYALMVN